MKLYSLSLSSMLLLSQVGIVHAVPLPNEKQLTLSEFLKPIEKNQKSLASVYYTFSGVIDDSINMIRLCSATNASCETCNTAFTIIDQGTPIPYSSFKFAEH